MFGVFARRSRRPMMPVPTNQGWTVSFGNPKYIVDGNLGTGDLNSDNMPVDAGAVFDFGVPTEFTTAAIYGPSGSNGDWAVRHKVQYSTDGTNWTSVFTGWDIVTPPTNVWHVRTFASPGAYRYWKFAIDVPGNSYSFREFLLY